MHAWSLVLLHDGKLTNVMKIAFERSEYVCQRNVMTWHDMHVCCQRSSPYKFGNYSSWWCAFQFYNCKDELGDFIVRREVYWAFHIQRWRGRYNRIQILTWAQFKLVRTTELVHSLAGAINNLDWAMFLICWSLRLDECFQLFPGWHYDMCRYAMDFLWLSDQHDASQPDCERVASSWIGSL